MKNIFLYPVTKSRNNFTPGSPYIQFFVQSLKKYYNFINIDDISNIGIFNIVKYLKRTDIVVFNWIENVPDKKGGYFQFVFLLILLPLFKIFKIKILWIIHNKISHVNKNFFFKTLIIKKLIKHSSYLLTHAKDGINFVRNVKDSGGGGLVYYITHPFFKPVNINNDAQMKYDILIWGSIWPYKGIDKFLQFLYDNELQNKFNIMISGLIYPESYIDELIKYQNKNIIIHNKFIPNSELENLIHASKIILFTYQKDSILSSAALMDSLVYGKIIVGPDSGAFSDLAEEKLIYVYNQFNELPNLFDKLLKDPKVDIERLNSFIKINSWENFSNKIHHWID